MASRYRPHNYSISMFSMSDFYSVFFFFGNSGTLSETFQHSSRRKQKNAMEKTFILISDILCLFIVPYCLATAKVPKNNFPLISGPKN